MSADARLREMFMQHYDFIWRSARRLGLLADDADDAAQKTFVVAQRRLSEIDGGKERAFLFSTLQRVVSDIRRSERRRREDPIAETMEDAQPEPDEVVEQKRARERLDVLLDSLPEDLRTVFVLYELEQMTTPEIASLLDVPLGTAASRLRRAREAFMAKLEGQS
jgi:RNA polymerase sigma-70 factor (ECF subfamily)